MLNKNKPHPTLLDRTGQTGATPGYDTLSTILVMPNNEGKPTLTLIVKKSAGFKRYVIKTKIVTEFMKTTPRW